MIRIYPKAPNKFYIFSIEIKQQLYQFQCGFRPEMSNKTDSIVHFDFDLHWPEMQLLL